MTQSLTIAAGSASAPGGAPASSPGTVACWKLVTHTRREHTTPNENINGKNAKAHETQDRQPLGVGDPHPRGVASIAGRVAAGTAPASPLTNPGPVLIQGQSIALTSLDQQVTA